jgi:hypothetical protein
MRESHEGEEGLIPGGFEGPSNLHESHAWSLPHHSPGSHYYGGFF